MKTLRDSAAVRWMALLLLALTIFCAYFFNDILSPIQDLLLNLQGWSNDDYGTYQSSYSILNVFLFFLIFAGIILDKMGVRFTALLSCSMMLTGAIIKWYAFTGNFVGSGLEQWLSSHLNYIPLFDELGVSPFRSTMPASAKLSIIGFMIFGSGIEMTSITVSRGIVKWFKGPDMAMAMGAEMALARLGTATVFLFSPFIASMNGNVSVSRPVTFGVAVLLAALVMVIVYFFMDKKLDEQTGEAEEKDEPFRLKDIKLILTSSGFWLVALFSLLFYSVVFIFPKYATNMLQCNLTLEAPEEGSFWSRGTPNVLQYVVVLLMAGTSFYSNFAKNATVRNVMLSVAGIALLVICYMGFRLQTAESILAVLQLLPVALTPMLGKYLGEHGKGASMLVLGALLLVLCNLIFAFLLPVVKGSGIGVLLAYITILMLGVAFSLVPAALWPSVPKLVDAKIIGSAYALIFWIQNMGMWLTPLLVGKILGNTNKNVDTASYDYVYAMSVFVVLSVIALIVGLILKKVDKDKNLGIEYINVTK